LSLVAGLGPRPSAKTTSSKRDKDHASCTIIIKDRVAVQRIEARSGDAAVSARYLMRLTTYGVFWCGYQNV
jgi:hypothetical protein